MLGSLRMTLLQRAQQSTDCAAGAGRRFVQTPSVERHLRNLARAVLLRRHPILLQGPTSSGKTSLVAYLAAQTGHHFVRINNHQQTDLQVCTHSFTLPLPNAYKTCVCGPFAAILSTLRLRCRSNHLHGWTDGAHQLQTTISSPAGGLQEYLGSYIADEAGRLVFREGALVTALRRGHWVVLDELNLAPSEVLEALNRRGSTCTPTMSLCSLTACTAGPHDSHRLPLTEDDDACNKNLSR